MLWHSDAIFDRNIQSFENVIIITSFANVKTLTRKLVPTRVSDRHEIVASSPLMLLEETTK